MTQCTYTANQVANDLPVNVNLWLRAVVSEDGNSLVTNSDMAYLVHPVKFSVQFAIDYFDRTYSRNTPLVFALIKYLGRDVRINQVAALSWSLRKYPYTLHEKVDAYLVDGWRGVQVEWPGEQLAEVPIDLYSAISKDTMPGEWWASDFDYDLNRLPFCNFINCPSLLLCEGGLYRIEYKMTLTNGETFYFGPMVYVGY